MKQTIHPYKKAFETVKNRNIISRELGVPCPDLIYSAMIPANSYSHLSLVTHFKVHCLQMARTTASLSSLPLTPPTYPHQPFVIFEQVMGVSAAQDRLRLGAERKLRAQCSPRSLEDIMPHGSY